jgi:signal transduction histidine kinase
MTVESTGGTDTGTDPATPLARVHLLFDDRTDARLVRTLLEPSYEVVESNEDLCDADLILVDQSSLGRHYDRIEQARTVTAPGYLPVLYFVQPGDSTPETGLANLVRAVVDDVVQMPVRRADLQRRVEVLLRTRSLSEDVQTLNAQLEFLHSLLRHEVLNGLQVLHSRSTMLSQELDGDQETQARTMLDWSTDMTEFVRRVGAVTEVIGDGDPPPVASVELEPLYDRLAARYEETYPDVCFTFDVAAGTAVLADEMLVDVLANLLTNAVSHNDARQPAIEVTTETEDEQVRITVADNGPGVPDETKQAVFDEGRSGLHTDTVNHGFGLYFVETKLDHYGGSVSVSDNDPRGAVFELTLQRVAENG